MRRRLVLAGVLVWFPAGLVLLAGAVAVSGATALKLQAHLLWGTDESKPPPGKNYQPVEPELRKKLKELPLKWANYFEVNHKNFTVSPGASSKVALSEKCELDVRSFGDSSVEVVLIGKGREVVRRKQSLPRGEILALGGNAPNATAWLVILNRVE